MKVYDFKPGDRVVRCAVETSSVPAGTIGTVRDARGASIVVSWEDNFNHEYTGAVLEKGWIELLQAPHDWEDLLEFV